MAEIEFAIIMLVVAIIFGIGVVLEKRKEIKEIFITNALLCFMFCLLFFFAGFFL